MIYIDTETHLISPGDLAPKLVCVQFCKDDGPVGVAVVGVDPVEDLLDTIFTNSAMIVGHNIAYDLLVVTRAFPRLVPLVFGALEEDRITDTMIREKLLRIKDGTLQYTRSFSLAAVAALYGCKKDADDPWRLRYSELEGIPFTEWPDAAQDYAIHDVEATRAVYLGQGEGAVSLDEGPQVRAAFALRAVEAAGIYTDPAAVDGFIRHVSAELARDVEDLKASGLVRADGSRDTKAAAARMLAIDPAAKRTPTGGVCLDEEACLDSDDSLLQAYQRYGSRSTLLGRLEGLRHPLINPGYDSLLATGRTSCRDGGGATHSYQIQNVRRSAGERECFVPADGECIIACDYSSFELCCLAQVCIDLFGESTLAKALRDDVDPHLLLAAKSVGISYEEAVSRKKEPGVKNARQVAKAANFGYPGGLGAEGFRRFARGYGVALSSEQARDLREDWFATWPEMRLYFDWVASHPFVDIIRKDNITSVTSVTQLGSGRVRGGCTYTVAANTMFQGLAADTAKAALYAVVRLTKMSEWFSAWKVWNFVHDEILIRGPVEDCDLAAATLESVMMHEAGLWLPDVPVKAEAVAMDRWSKSAEKTLDEEGKLVPFIVGGA